MWTLKEREREEITKYLQRHRRPDRARENLCLCDLCRSTTMIRYVCVVALSFSSRSSTSSPYSALDWYPGTLHCCVFCAGQYGKCPDSLVDTGKLQQGSKCQGMYYMHSCIHVSICLYVHVCLSVCVSLKSLGITWLSLLTVLEFLAFQHTHVRFISFLSFSLTKLLALSQSHSLYIAVLTCEPVRAPVLAAATCRLAGRAAGRHCKHFIYKVH